MLYDLPWRAPPPPSKQVPVSPGSASPRLWVVRQACLPRHSRLLCAVWFWVIFSTCLSLSFLVCNKGVMVPHLHEVIVD